MEEEQIKQELENMKEVIRTIIKTQRTMTIGFGLSIMCVAIAGIMLGASI